jgi:2-polyprenyl-3-methyl-5-hydroxy-6-metoxy-1,4-benzoquinol methylase
MNPDAELQCASLGSSANEIHEAVLTASNPRTGLKWVDIGCGTGAMLRTIRDRHEPARLSGVDILNWLDSDLHPDVDFICGPAESAIAGLEPVDRVLMVEVLEHLESPWTVLRLAARLVAPGGMIVVSTPNLASLRHRLEMLVRAQLSSFRPDNPAHLTPVLPHTVRRVLEDEGLEVAHSYAARDIIPYAGGRLYPRILHRRAPKLTSISLIVTGVRQPRD